MTNLGLKPQNWFKNSEFAKQNDLTGQNGYSLTLSPMGGGPPRPNPIGIGDCSKTNLYITLKLLDFSYISKTEILKKKKIPTPPRMGVLKKLKKFKLVGEPKL